MDFKMKKLPLAILGTAALSIPVKAIAHDSDGLYGTPDSLSEQPPKIEESSLIRLPVNTEKNLAISNHIQRMYSDPEYAQDYIYNKEEILKEMGISLSEIDTNPSVKFLEVVSDPRFREASSTRDYDNFVQLLVDYNLVNADDFSKLVPQYQFYIEQNKSEYEKLFLTNNLSSVRLGKEGDYTQACVTCISFAAVAVNAVAATNVAVAVILVVYAGTYVWGYQDPYSLPNNPDVRDSEFGKVALSNTTIANNKGVAFSVAQASGVPNLSNYIYKDIAKSELRAFYTAAYNLGLIDNEDNLDYIIQSAINELDTIKLPNLK